MQPVSKQQPIEVSWDFLREILEHILKLIPRGNVTVQSINDPEIIKYVIALRVDAQNLIDRAIYLMRKEYKESENPELKKEIAEYYNPVECTVPELLKMLDLGLQVSGIDITEPEPDYQYADDYEKSCAEEAEAMKNAVILNRMNKGGC